MTSPSNDYISWKKWDQEEFGKLTYGGEFYFNQFFRKYKLLKKNKKILEIGFGNGGLLGYLKKHSNELIGVETNTILVSRAVENGYGAFAGLVWEVSELDDKKFDLIFAFDVVEHMSVGDLKSFFSWVAKHLDAYGSLILRFPEGASPLGLAYQHGDFTHATILTRNKLISLCDINELTLISYDDEYLRSDKLCSYGLIGKFFLLILQAYAKFLRNILKFFLFPLSTDLRLSTNSIVIIKKI